ncbi:MAG: hypothetical protein O2973_04880 [Gemmatimonadetes bacterium]|nr:hypothetical protein [Gemmatimonadota bacterium]
MIPEKFLKLAALGALSVAPATVAVYAVLIFAFQPTPTGGIPGSGGGIDAVSWWVLIAAMFVPLSLVAAWHVDFGKQLKAGKNSCPGC